MVSNDLSGIVLLLITIITMLISSTIAHSEGRQIFKQRIPYKTVVNQKQNQQPPVRVQQCREGCLEKVKNIFFLLKRKEKNFLLDS